MIYEFVDFDELIHMHYKHLRIHTTCHKNEQSEYGPYVNFINILFQVENKEKTGF